MCHLFDRIAVTDGLKAQAWRYLAAAAAVRGADAAGPDRLERSPASAHDSGSDGKASGIPSSVASSSSDETSRSPGVEYMVDFRRVVTDKRTGEQGALEGVIHIQNTFNNIILTLTDQKGFIKTYTSAGIVGFRGARRSQPVAAEQAAEELARRALKLGYSTVSVRLKGPGNTKQYAVQSLAASGLHISSLADVTPIPYNGCRLPKRRRV